MIRTITHALTATVLASSFAMGCTLDTGESDDDRTESQTDEIQGQNASDTNASGQNTGGQNASGQNASGQNASGQNAGGQNTCSLEVVITDACHDEAYFEAVAADICAQSNLTLRTLELFQSCAWAGNAYAHLYAEARFECCPDPCSNTDPNCAP